MRWLLASANKLRPFYSLYDDLINEYVSVPARA
jgi:hypothetical protein